MDQMDQVTLVRYNNFALLNCLVQHWSMLTWLSFKLNVND